MDLLDATLPDDARHPWEKARYAFFAKVLERHGVLRGAPKVLDVGSGDGWFARQVERAHPAASFTCWDVNYPLAHREEGRIRYVRDEPEGRASVLFMLDVLEHVENDFAFLSSLVEQHLEPSATVLFSVPAWQAMYSEHDRALKHFRRYSPKSATRVLERAGLEIVEKGGLFHSLLVPRAVALVLEKLGRKGEVAAEEASAWNAPRAVTAVVDGALAVDGLVSRIASKRGVELPGLSFWALAKRSR